VRVVVMGCGRVGASLSDSLSRIGHDVAVIDRDSTHFTACPRFHGERVLGMGFDRDVLCGRASKRPVLRGRLVGRQLNIISARVARETFGVERVVARIYDASARPSTNVSAIPTVATVPWTTDRLLNVLTRETETTSGATRPATVASPSWRCTRTGSATGSRPRGGPPAVGWRS